MPKYIINLICTVANKNHHFSQKQKVTLLIKILRQNAFPYNISGYFVNGKQFINFEIIDTYKFLSTKAHR